MAYRAIDDLARRDAIEKELSALDPGDRRWLVLREELERIDLSRREAVRVRLPLVAGARAASRCDERFETMVGDGAIRTCTRCDEEVLDVARMTLDEADAILGAGACASAPLRVRHDGTLRRRDCKVGAEAVRTRRLRVAAASIALAAAMLARVVDDADTRYFGPPPPQPRRPVSIALLEGPAAGETVIDRERRSWSLLSGGCPEGYIRHYMIEPASAGEGCDTPDLPCNRCVPDLRGRPRR